MSYDLQNSAPCLEGPVKEKTNKQTNNNNNNKQFKTEARNVFESKCKTKISSAF